MDSDFAQGILFSKSRDNAKKTFNQRKDNISTQEKARILQGEPVIEINGDERFRDKEYTKNYVLNLFKQWGNKATNPEAGVIEFDKRSYKDSVSHNNHYTKALAFQSVKSVIEKGAVVAQVKEKLKHNIHISAPVMIDGEKTIVTVLAHKDINKNKMYVHSVHSEKHLLRHATVAPDFTVGETDNNSTRGAVIEQKISNYNLKSILKTYLTVKLDETIKYSKGEVRERP
ncbi:hypothetical protein [Taylorella asinigenitalis]|uniref:LPD3 domain-containing protein n=1 Tax=Taylorella asinigenitalis TaxID=84590 RepID=UPI00048AFB31|nr:hypothetical protein [Taylorella asinigenitalis]